MTVKLKINDKEFLRALKGATDEGLLRTTIFAHQQAQRLLNVSNPGRRVPTKTVNKQAEEQLGDARKSGLINVSYERKKKDGTVESFSAWHYHEGIGDGENKTSVTVYPYPSHPGEPPRKRTGFGQRNVVWGYDPKKMEGRYGVKKNNLYMFYLELGTRRVKARPWMLRALMDNLKMVTALLQTGKKKHNL